MKNKTIITLFFVIAVICTYSFADITLPNGDPDPAYSNFYAWYKADSGVLASGGAAGDGDEVVEWENALGDTSRDLDNPVGSVGTLTYKTNIVNGKPAVDFPNGKGLRKVEAFWGSIAQPNTYFLVVRQDDRTQTDFILDGATSTKRNILLSSGGTWAFNGRLQISSGNVVQDDFSVHSLMLNGASTDSLHYVNGQLWGSGIAALSTDERELGGLILGIHQNTAGNAFDGAIAEVLVYDGSVTDDEREAIEDYLIAKYDITKRRSSGTLVHKYDGSDITTSGATVTSWNDQVGDWDLTANAEPNSPLAGSISFPAGSFNALSFDGVDDALQYVENDPNFYVPQPSTIVVVAKRNTQDGETKIIFDGAETYHRNILSAGVVDGSYVNRMFGGNYNIEMIDADDNMWQIFVANFDNFWTELYVDGFYGGSALAGKTSLGGITVGSRYDFTKNFFDGQIAELQIYDGALDDTAREAVEDALFAKYGISPTCGAAYTVYTDNDLNKDCYVNFGDLAEIAESWLDCSDPGNDDCASYYQD